MGRSSTARFYAIADRQEAEEYASHPVLGPRLDECTAAMLSWGGQRSAGQILGPVDALKFISSMTLFEAAAEDPTPFAQAVDVYGGGKRDPLTLSRL